MKPRTSYQKHVPQAVHALLALDRSLAESTLGHTLLDLVRIRASQLNGCLFCLDLHHKEAKSHGERELRLYHLPLWRESKLYSERERAALEWTELMTSLGHHGLSDADYGRLSAPFSEKEISELGIAVSSINAWNRLGVAFLPEPGSLDKVMGLDKLGLI